MLPDTETQTPDTPPVDQDAAMLEAMDAGIKTATEPVEPVPETPAPVADLVPGTPEALAAEQTAADKSAKEAAATPVKPEPDTAVESEITTLGLKVDAAARFRELADEVRTLRPIREQMDKAGIKDFSELPAIMQHAKDGRDLVDLVQGTGASSEHFGMTLDYLTVTSKALAGDRAAMQQAYDLSMGEAKGWAEQLGIDVEGVNDPLAAHPDLIEEIEVGDLTRKRALEIAGQRAATANANARKQLDEQAGEETTRQTQAQAEALEYGRVSLNELGAELATDPSYAEKLPALKAAVAAIKSQFPPDQWAVKTMMAYAKLAPAPAVKPDVINSPARPGAQLRPMLMPDTIDPMEALNFGIASAS